MTNLVHAELPTKLQGSRTQALLHLIIFHLKINVWSHSIPSLWKALHKESKRTAEDCSFILKDSLHVSSLRMLRETDSLHGFFWSPSASNDPSQTATVKPTRIRLQPQKRTFKSVSWKSWDVQPWRGLWQTLYDTILVQCVLVSTGWVCRAAQPHIYILNLLQLFPH